MSTPRTQSTSAPDLGSVPRTSPLLIECFARYTRWYLRRHFHNLRLSTEGWLPDTENGVPKVIFLNHASWWDPLVCLHLSRQTFRSHRSAAPIDAQALAQYPFFRRLGFFGVEPDTNRGAATFLRIASDLVSHPWSLLWITPQGRFADVRERPMQFKQGLGHLAARVARKPVVRRHPAAAPDRLQFVPLAIEYTPWHERLPEVLLRFGAPIELSAHGAESRDAAGWTRHFEDQLQRTMEALSVQACRRDPSKFLNLLNGQTGVGGFYDLWRRCRAAFRRTRFDPRHGTL
jgi:1-acyl-sn-glycerol-3-phosphate acyltransferase